MCVSGKKASVVGAAGFALILLMACGTDQVIDDVATDSEDPMRFGLATTGVETKASLRAAGDPLTHGFVVSTYKQPASGTTQTVMDRYEAVYKSSAWYQNSSWGTVGKPDEFYQEQFERYWDYSARSYRFHAVAPSTDRKAKDYVDAACFGLTDTELHLPDAASFSLQTVSDGHYSKASELCEPYMVAQVERQLNGAASAKDYDRLAKDPTDPSKPLEINKEKGTASGRSVALPFHHLTSRVRFAIYTTVAHCPASLNIHNVTLSAASADGLVTGAANYGATLTVATDFLHGSFGSLTREGAEAQLSLLTLTGPSGDSFPEAYLDKHMSKDKAYFFECKEGLIQIPQAGVKLYGDMRVGSHRYTFQLRDAAGNDTFTWEPNKLYTYYIIISNIEPFMIHFTATLTDWEDVSGSFSVDLED